MGQIHGFYGGKFMPMHKGHLYCIDTAARMCDHVVVIMFINGDDELDILKTHHEEMLSVGARIEQLEKVCTLYPNVEYHIIDDNWTASDVGSAVLPLYTASYFPFIRWTWYYGLWTWCMYWCENGMP